MSWLTHSLDRKLILSSLLHAEKRTFCHQWAEPTHPSQKLHKYRWYRGRGGKKDWATCQSYIRWGMKGKCTLASVCRNAWWTFSWIFCDFFFSNPSKLVSTRHFFVFSHAFGWKSICRWHKKANIICCLRVVMKPHLSIPAFTLRIIWLFTRLSDPVLQ